MKVILYSKPGCHLCEGLQEKLEQMQGLTIDLEIRDITTRSDWFETYQYEIPVLLLQSGADPSPTATGANDSLCIRLPRPSPRATVSQLEQMLQKYSQLDPTQ